MTSIRSLRQEPFQFFQGITKSYFTHYSYTLFVVQFNADLCCPVFLEFLFRSSYRRCCGRKGALISFAKPTGKHPRPSLSFNKAAGLRSATLLKKRLQHRRSPRISQDLQDSKNILFVEHLQVTVFCKTSFFCLLCNFAM